MEIHEVNVDAGGLHGIHFESGEWHRVKLDAGSLFGFQIGECCGAKFTFVPLDYPDDKHRRNDKGFQPDLNAGPWVTFLPMDSFTGRPLQLGHVRQWWNAENQVVGECLSEHGCGPGTMWIHGRGGVRVTVERMCSCSPGQLFCGVLRSGPPGL